MTIDGIDVSSNNSAGQLATLDWRGVSFGVVKASEGDTYKNDRRFDEAEAVRKHGAALLVYHWFKPWISVAAQLANFRDAVVGMGDWLAWYLDLEDASRPASDSEWGVSTSAMLTVCKQQFAPKRGGLYVGQFFHPNSLLPLALDNFWWDPDYGHNDGVEHPILNGRKPVIHQYTSVNGLDRNRVHDEVAFHQLLGAAAPTPAAPTPEDTMASRLTFFTIPDHPDVPHRATVYRTDGLIAENNTPQQVEFWQFVERVHGATAADVQVGTMPYAVASQLPGVFRLP